MAMYRGEKKFPGRTLLVAAAFLGLLAFAGAPRVSAESYASCRRRIAKADHKLHEAVEHHGWDSRQADHARHELHEAREHCWNERHRWREEVSRKNLARSSGFFGPTGIRGSAAGVCRKLR